MMIDDEDRGRYQRYARQRKKHAAPRSNATCKHSERTQDKSVKDGNRGQEAFVEIHRDATEQQDDDRQYGTRDRNNDTAPLHLRMASVFTI
jgi:hypothetical protein